MLNWDAILGRTMPVELRQAMILVEKAIEQGNPYLSDPAGQPQRTQRVIALVFMSIAIHGFPGVDSHMVGLLNGKRICVQPILYKN